jgi:hypothetical protein
LRLDCRSRFRGRRLHRDHSPHVVSVAAHSPAADAAPKAPARRRWRI